MSKCKKFVMWLEPHTPDGKNKCAECVLSKGPMCLDRSYCELIKTGKTWRICLDPPKSEINEIEKPANNNERDEICPACDGVGSIGRNSQGDEYDCGECDGTGKRSPVS